VSDRKGRRTRELIQNFVYSLLRSFERKLIFSEDAEHVVPQTPTFTRKRCPHLEEDSCSFRVLVYGASEGAAAVVPTLQAYAVRL
jgi:hypothetical protein